MAALLSDRTRRIWPEAKESVEQPVAWIGDRKAGNRILAARKLDRSNAPRRNADRGGMDWPHEECGWFRAMTIARIMAPAKLNLGLEILGKRADGYHEIRTIMQAISLCDTLSAVPAAEVSLTVDGDELDYADNLVYKAVTAWSQAAGSPRSQLAVSLAKRIPTSSGLGGASSDAAAT